MKLKLILMARIPAVAAMCIVTAAQAGSGNRPPPVQLPKSPISPSTLLIQGLKAGTIHLSPAWAHEGKVHRPLNCSPTPCALPNVEGSNGATQPVNETPIAINPLNKTQLITGGNDYNCTGTSYRGFWTSNDRGKTWFGQCGIDVTGQTGSGGPVVGYDLQGNVYQGGIDSGGISIASSPDNGQTWSKAVISNAVKGLTADKPWLEIDTNPGSPTKNTLYVSNTMFARNSDSTIYVSHSSDGGQTWHIVQASPTAQYPNFVNQFSDLAIGSDGTVYLTYLNCPATKECGGQKSTMYIQKSTDGGNTWSPQVVVDTPTLAPGSCKFYGCLPNTSEPVSDIPVIGIDNTGVLRRGQLYVVDYTWTGSHMRVQVTSSTDGGASWSTPVPVAPRSDKHDQFFPWLNVNGSGNVGVTWLDRRNDANNVNYEAFASWSNDGGTSFKTNIQIADKPSDPFDDGFDGGFMGDYTGNAWFGKNLYAAWTDTRNGSYSQNEVGGLKR